MPDIHFRTAASSPISRAELQVKAGLPPADDLTNLRIIEVIPPVGRKEMRVKVLRIAIAGEEDSLRVVAQQSGTRSPTLVTWNEWTGYWGILLVGDLEISRPTMTPLARALKGTATAPTSQQVVEINAAIATSREEYRAWKQPIAQAA